MKLAIHKQPRKSKEHLTLDYLHMRQSLSPEETLRYETLQKGYEGEIKFHNLVTSTYTTGLFQFDFLFSSNGTEFQMDSLSIEDQTITLFEVKNFRGDFIINNEQWHLVSSEKEIRNPLIQLQRSEFLLRHLLRDTFPQVTVKAYLVFVHEGFMLYQAPLNIPAIFPTQLTRFQNSIAARRKNTSKRVSNIAEHLASLHITESTYAKTPNYTYEAIQKGIPCRRGCHGFMGKYMKSSLRCSACGHTKPFKTILFELIKEYHFLFPERKITTGAIHEWSNYEISKSAILFFLKSHLKPTKNGRFTHYQF